MDKKKLPGKVRTMIIGAFTVLGVAILVGSIFFFKPSVGDNKQRLNIKFSNVEGLTDGTRVTYAGKPAGEVLEINQIIDARQKQVDDAGLPYTYEVTVALDTSVQVYSTDLIEIRTSGLLGEKSIAIVPQHITQGEKSHSVIGGTIYAQSADPLSTTLKTVTTTADEIGRTMNNISILLEKNNGNITQVIENFNVALQGASELINQANQVDIVDSFNRAALDISRLANNTSQIVDNFRNLHLLEKLDLTLDNIDLSLCNFNQITTAITESKGTIGKLVNDPTLYLQATDLFKRVNQLVYDVNNYGLLFHKNARWKNLQEERLSLNQNLSSPQSFVNEVGSEMKQINQSVNKIGDYIQTSNQTSQEVVDSNEFRKYFYNLIQEISQLKSMIDLYNQKVSNPNLKP